MWLSWTEVQAPTVVLPREIHVRQLDPADEAALGWLMWACFQDSVTDSYATAADAAGEVTQTLAGKWGPVVWTASLVAVRDGLVIAAVVVVLDDAHDHVPLLAYVMTDPAYRRRGVARRVIEESISLLAAAGMTELHLAVARANPAVGLYRRLGFHS